MKPPLCSSLAALAFVITPALGDAPVWSSGEGVNGTVTALAVQADGGIVVGGLFSAVQGRPRQNLARLNADGSLDGVFEGQGINGQVFALAARPGGGFVAGGDFNQALGTECMNVAVFGPDGSLDPVFHGQGRPVFGTNGPVRAVAVQPGGEIVVGGAFSTANGQPRMSIARFLADGTLDSVPSQSGVEGPVEAAVPISGAVLCGGVFRSQDTGAASLLKIPIAAGDNPGKTR